MPLQANIDAATFDSLPDVTVLGKDSFIRTDDKIFLNLSSEEAGKLAFTLQESVRKLTDNNKELLRQKGEANRDAEGFKSLGLTPEEIKAALDSKRPEEFQAILAKKDEEIQAIRASATEASAKDKADAEDARRKLADTLLDVRVERLMNEFELKPAARFALKDHLRVERDEQTGEYIERVYENGALAYHGPDPMKPEQLVKQWAEKKMFPELFVVGNSDSPGNPNRKINSGLNKQLEGLPAVERLKVARQNGATT